MENICEVCYHYAAYGIRGIWLCDYHFNDMVDTFRESKWLSCNSNDEELETYRQEFNEKFIVWIDEERKVEDQIKDWVNIN